jgi:uncharacterized RmlC-like cupin family protein
MPDGHGGRLRHIRVGQLDPETAQTGGIRRAAAICMATTGSTGIWMGGTRVAPATVSAAHHHGHSGTGSCVVSGIPAFVVLDGDEAVRLQADPGDHICVPAFAHREANPPPTRSRSS